MAASKKINWESYFKPILKMIEGKPQPYVSRLANSIPNDEAQRAFQVLIATLLSLRTRDKVNEIASEKLFALAKTPQDMLKLSAKTIEAAIYPTTFYGAKAKDILLICQTLLEKYNGKVPKSIEELTKFRGVGRKTANLVMVAGFGLPGICVDIHVHRILNRLGLVHTKTPDETELVLRKILPEKYWKDINRWLVMFGMYQCKPIIPLCEMCLLLAKCPYGQMKMNTQRQ